MKIYFLAINEIEFAMKAPKPCYPTEEAIFMMDSSHPMKKKGNDFMKSGVHDKKTQGC